MREPAEMEACQAFSMGGMLRALREKLLGQERERIPAPLEPKGASWPDDAFLVLKESFLRGYATGAAAGTPDEKAFLIREIPLVWKGYFHAVSGYGQGTRDYVRELKRRQWHLFRDSLKGDHELDPCFFPGISSLPPARSMKAAPFISLQHVPPLQLQRLEGAYSIGITTWETSRLPPRWAEACNAVDELWVASSFNERAFKDSGVRVPIRVLPYGVDLARFHPAVEPLRELPELHIATKKLRDFFIFLSVGAFYPYKGFDALMAAYIKEFSSSDGVVLIIKVYPYFGHTIQGIGAFIRTLSKKFGRKKIPRILFLQETYVSEMPSLMALADAYICSSRGEGFCLPLLEAMAMGKIVLSPAWGGQVDYLHEKNCYLVACREVPVRPGSHLYHSSGTWAEPDIEHMGSQMRQVLEHREEAMERASRACHEARGAWSTAHAADILERYLLELCR
ncbi:MAG: glycosyltransferase [Candidatus Eremiobacteraeota bacterium]|nr:glycosyltransferase [Candidatus Eremiobacteraeota bacterium]